MKESEFELNDVINDWDLNFNLGNVTKYIARAAKKVDDPVHDLRKAKWYLEREILMLERESIDWDVDRYRVRNHGDRHNF